MTTLTHPTNVYTDINGLTKLRREAQRDQRGALREVAQQFEAVFLQMMLKSMRAASLGEGILDSDQSEQYRELLDSQLSINLSQGRGLGLADSIVRQLGGEAEAPRSPQSGAAAPSARRSGGSRETVGAFAEPSRLPPLLQGAAASSHRVQNKGLPTSDAVLESRVPSSESRGLSPELRFDSPAAFVEALSPYAQQAARLLGLGPEVLIAQAALETGWGQAVIRDARGESSHNLFNIKADHRWDGPVVAKNTLEYMDGVAVRERGLFRRYDSPAQSFQDYVEFLQGNARYAPALAQSGDAHGFLGALQAAGYATDPAYATKIGAILERFKSGELPPIPST